MQKINWEKIGIYLAVLTGFLLFINNLMDIKERIAKLEVKVEHLEQHKGEK